MKRLFLMLTAMVFAMNVNASDSMGFDTSEEVVQTALVNFATASATLNAQAKARLSKLDLSDKNADVVIIGKTDSRGSEEYNVELGMRRAQSVANFLKVSDASISSVGKAEASNPANMLLDRVAIIKIITLDVTLNPVFGATNNTIMGPTHHIQYNTLPQGMNRIGNKPL